MFPLYNAQIERTHKPAGCHFVKCIKVLNKDIHHERVVYLTRDYSCGRCSTLVNLITIIIAPSSEIIEPLKVMLYFPSVPRFMCMHADFPVKIDYVVEFAICHVAGDKNQLMS